MKKGEQTAPATGLVVEIAPGLRRILAPNPSPMTYWGTNTYLLGDEDVAVIDPGPRDRSHLEAILAALTLGQRITHIFVTHAHIDHSGLARDLAEETGARILAFGSATTGRSADMSAIAEQFDDHRNDGVDHDFAPDDCLMDGETITAGGWTLEAIWTPGHLSNHLCFASDDALFCGDHVMGWSSSIVSPPGGDLTAFMASCRKLQGRAEPVFFPGHGAPLFDPQSRLAWLIAHRNAREAAILARLEQSEMPLSALTRSVYDGIVPALLPAAERNVLAHLIDLSRRGLVAPTGPWGQDVTYRRVARGK
ncbi:MBL fold metallo-hydrolase [Poseidonocella sedimentorum]|uniref:Glyoxylase, beta-lactamase superfamily II n=1 Tax=Poseidonocella sedimentorum TaxID=871652 RepID=A0A1I6EPP4_9RHOB|nr:MBL fold metallo-hydrolase [Poseidonocella sedimentorum]SFR19462.1 Glyoxylase, beta-lactamase superfamily II [Poseidonocella sedimentorum]